MPTVLLRATFQPINTFSLFEISKPFTLSSTTLPMTFTFSEVSTQMPLSSEPVARLQAMRPLRDSVGKIP